MRIIARRTLREFWEKHPDTEQPLKVWYREVKQVDWKKPSDIKSLYRQVSFVGNDRVVFNTKGNKYRLITAVDYRFGIVYIRFVGSHKQYDAIDAATI
jgi:mRNA interferase HigB